MATSAKSSKDLLAVVNGNDLDRLKKILQSGVDPNINRDKDFSHIPLLVAVENGEVEKIKCLLQFKAYVNIEDAVSRTALYLAACNGHADTLELLISHGADVNKQRTGGGWTALHDACYYGYVACARVLLEHGADVALRGSDGKTARDRAVENKKADVVKLLDDFVHGTRSKGLASMCDSMAGELRDLKEKVRELDSVKTELASLKAKMKLSARRAEMVQLLASKAELDQLSTLKTEVAQLSTLKTEVAHLSASKADVEQLPTFRVEVKTAIEQHANDLSSLIEELFPKEDQLLPTPSIEIQLHSISQRQDVEDNWWNISKELGFSRSEMFEFAAKYKASDDMMQPFIHKMLQTWCDNSQCNTDDEKMREIWRVLGKFGVREEERSLRYDFNGQAL